MTTRTDKLLVVVVAIVFSSAVLDGLMAAGRHEGWWALLNGILIGAALSFTSWAIWSKD